MGQGPNTKCEPLYIKIETMYNNYTLEERRTEEERRLKKVCTTLYWLGRVAAQRHNYLGPQLNLDAFAPLIFGFASSLYKETTSSGISSYDSSDTTTSRYTLGLLDDVFVHNEENVRHYQSRACQSNRISTSSSESGDNEDILSGFEFLSSSREDIVSSSDCSFSREYRRRRRRRAAMEKMHSSGLSRSFDSSMLNHKEMTPEESDEWMSSLSSWKSKRIQYTSTERERKAERDEVEQNENQRHRRKSKTYREIVEEKEKREKALQKIYKKKASVDDEDIDYIMKTDTKLITMSEDEDSSPEEENLGPQTRYRSNTLPKSFGSQFKEAPPTAPKPATRLARRIQAHKKAPEESSAPPVRNRPSVIGLFDEPDGEKKPEPETVNEPIVQQQFNSMEKSKPHDFRGNFQSKLVSAREREHAENSKNSTVWQPEKRRVSLGIKSRMAAYNQSLDLDSQVTKKPEPKKDNERKPESDAKNRPFIEKTISMTQRPCNEKGFGFTFSGGSEVKKPPIIEKIKKFSTASSTDLQPGDVIVSVNGDKVLSASYEEVEYSISHAVLIGKMSIKIRRYDVNADSGSVPLDDNPFKSMLSDEPIIPPSMGVKRSTDRKIATHEPPVRDVPTSKPVKKPPVKLPETRNKYRQQSYSPPLNRNQSNHHQDESVVDGRVVEEPMIQPEKKESKTFASQELFKPIVEDVCQQHVLQKDEGAQDLNELFNKLEQIRIKAEKEKDADDERSMSETEAEQYEAEIIEQMQREAEAERQREERHRSIEEDEMPVESLVSHTVKKPEPNLNFERFQEHNKPGRSKSPSYSVPKPFKTPKYQPVPLRAKKDPEQGREKLTKRRSDFFNEEDGKNVEDLWKQVEQQGEKEKAPQPAPASKPNRRSFNVDEERKRLERWQQEQERLRQERYAKDQEKLRQENQKALERAAEDEKRKKQEEEMKINEMTQKLISPREEIDRSIADQFMDKLLEEEQIRDSDARSANVMAERERLARQQQEEAWEREKLQKEKELERKAKEREIKLKEERERQEQERIAQARRDEEIRKEHEAMERKLKEEKERLDRKWQELQREKEMQEERERQERERLEQLRAEQDRLRQERFRLEQQQLEEKRLLDQEKERLIRQTRAEAQQHQLPNKSQYRQLAGIAKEPKAIDRDNPFKTASDTDTLEDKFLPKDNQSKNNAHSFARDRNDNKVIPEKDRTQQVSYMSKYKDPSMPQNTHWLVQEAERRRIADQKKRDMESPTNQIKSDLDNEPVLEKEKAFNVESAKTVFTESAPNSKYIEDEQPVRMRPKRGNAKEWQAKKENRRSMPTLDSQLEDDPRQTQDDADVIRRSYGLNDTFAAPPSSTNGPLPDAVMQTFPQNNVSKPANTQLPKLGQGSAFQPLGQKKQPRSVSGKVSCTNCTKPLGRGAAMIIESLGLHYHIDCFRCCVCSIRLGNGSKGTDVRIRASKLHCQSCYSNDAGFEFTEV